MCHERESVEPPSTGGQCSECEETVETQLHWPGPGTHYLTLSTTQEISAETREKAPGDKEQVLSK